MGMTNQEEQAIMDSICGKSYDDRWHTVVSDMDFEEFELLANREVENGDDNRGNQTSHT